MNTIKLARNRNNDLFHLVLVDNDDMIVYDYGALSPKQDVITQSDFTVINNGGRFDNYLNTSLVSFKAQNNYPPTTNPATPDIYNDILLLDFDASTDEEAIFIGVLPKNYSGEGLTVKLFFASGATAGGTFINWEVAFDKLDNGNGHNGGYSFDTAKNMSVGLSASANNFVISSASISFDANELDDMVAGDLFAVKVRRDADGTSGTDTLLSDASLIALDIYDRG